MANRQPGDQEDQDWQRLDKWLWCARLIKHRADCGRLTTQGCVRINRQPTDKPHARLRVGDSLTLAIRNRVLVIRILHMAARRGPAPEAHALYKEITEPCMGAERPALPPPDSPLPESPR